MEALGAIVFAGLLLAAGATAWLLRSGRAVPAPWFRLRQTPWLVVTNPRDDDDEEGDGDEHDQGDERGSEATRRSAPPPGLFHFTSTH